MIEYWIINSLIFTLPLSWYMIYQMYKDCKKKDKIIELQNNIIKNNSNIKVREEIKKYEGRRIGNTTRYIDSLIQDLFNKGEIILNTSIESRRVLDIICKRLASEHPFNKIIRKNDSIKLIN